MTLAQMAPQYHRQALRLKERIVHLEARCRASESAKERARLRNRVRSLREMQREARELAVLTERYYERGYRRNAKYTL